MGESHVIQVKPKDSERGKMGTTFSFSGFIDLENGHVVK